MAKKTLIFFKKFQKFKRQSISIYNFQDDDKYEKNKNL